MGSARHWSDFRYRRAGCAELPGHHSDLCPGDALLEFVITPEGQDKVELKMVSRFLPRGLAGMLFWYALLPTHRWLFEGMLRAVAAKTGLPVIDGPEKAPLTWSLECRL